jgi:Na+-transporting NADH:ubiquinone oxidoreductase subunit NqrF
MIYQLQLGPISSSAAVKLVSIVSLQYCANVKWNAEMKTNSNKATHIKEAWPKRRVGYNWLQTYIQIRTSPK